jgi:purine nucleoside permease
MEDSGSMQALTLLSKAGKADFSRVLVVRAASDLTVPPPGESTINHLNNDGLGYLTSVESFYRAASTIAAKLVEGWPDYEQRPPVTAGTSENGEKSKR